MASSRTLRAMRRVGCNIRIEAPAIVELFSLVYLASLAMSLATGSIGREVWQIIAWLVVGVRVDIRFVKHA